MVSFFGAMRKTARHLLLAAATVFVAACDPAMLGFSGQNVNPNAPVPVALIVPGNTGQAGDDILSRSLENAARLAISDLQGPQIDLRVYSAGATPNQAAAAAIQAVNDGAKIILGPVYADAANAAGLAVAARNVNVLSFSNNAEIAGGNVFILGNTFQNTAIRLVDFAARQGRARIFIVHEQTPAGEVGKTAIQTAIARSSASLAGIQSFPYSQDGIIAAIPPIARMVQSAGADAIFLTATADGALPYLGQLLPEAGLTPDTIKYLGLTRWDVQPATLSLPGVQGGWFAMPDPTLDQRFQARYQAAYGSPPHPIAGLAYDAIAAIGALLGEGRRDALTTAALTQPSGFVGVGGIFRLRADGTNERGLAIAEVRDSQVVVIDPAPRSFAGAGL